LDWQRGKKKKDLLQLQAENWTGGKRKEEAGRALQLPLDKEKRGEARKCEHYTPGRRKRKKKRQGGGGKFRCGFSKTVGEEGGRNAKDHMDVGVVGKKKKEKGGKDILGDCQRKKGKVLLDGKVEDSTQSWAKKKEKLRWGFFPLKKKASRRKKVPGSRSRLAHLPVAR